MQPVNAVLLDTTNPAAGPFRGRTGRLYCEVGSRCLFDDLLTSAVEGLVWFGSRIEVYTQNARYVFKLENDAGS
jgi:hypothetical protein